MVTTRCNYGRGPSRCARHENRRTLCPQAHSPLLPQVPHDGKTGNIPRSLHGCADICGPVTTKPRTVCFVRRPREFLALRAALEFSEISTPTSNCAGADEQAGYTNRSRAGGHSRVLLYPPLLPSARLRAMHLRSRQSVRNERFGLLF